MLRWWRGIAVCLLLALGPALAAQSPADLPPCDLDARQAELDAHRLAVFTGCPLDQAIIKLRRNDYGIEYNVDPSASGYPRGTITQQSNINRAVTLGYADGRGYPPAPPPAATPVRFSLAAPREVAEGGKFTLTINRDRDDGQAHALSLAYSPAGLLTDPPTNFTFSGTGTSSTIPLQTATGTPGDGEKRLVIAITDADAGAAPGKPPQLAVRITDSRPAQSYTVATGGEVRHDAPITFIVSRTDVADPSKPTYDLREDGTLLRSVKEVTFADGQPSWQMQVDPGEYGHCTGSVEFVLHRAGGDQVLPAVFADEIPADCNPPPPIWPKIAGGIAVIIAICIGLYTWPWIPKRVPPPSPPPAPPAPPPISARASCEPPRVPPLILDERALRWPGASAAVHLEPGETHLPDHLPVESDDHG